MVDGNARHLRRGVHAGVGAAGGVQRIMRADDGRDLVFEDLLDADPLICRCQPA